MPIYEARLIGPKKSQNIKIDAVRKNSLIILPFFEILDPHKISEKLFFSCHNLIVFDCSIATFNKSNASFTSFSVFTAFWHKLHSHFPCVYLKFYRNLYCFFMSLFALFLCETNQCCGFAL